MNPAASPGASQEELLHEGRRAAGSHRAELPRQRRLGRLLLQISSGIARREGPSGRIPLVRWRLSSRARGGSDPGYLVSPRAKALCLQYELDRDTRIALNGSEIPAILIEWPQQVFELQRRLDYRAPVPPTA